MGVVKMVKKVRPARKSSEKLKKTESKKSLTSKTSKSTKKSKKSSKKRNERKYGNIREIEPNNLTNLFWDIVEELASGSDSEDYVPPTESSSAESLSLDN